MNQPDPSVPSELPETRSALLCAPRAASGLYLAGLCLATALVGPAWAGPPQFDQGAGAPQEGDDFQPAPFHLYDTQLARVRAAEALEHIQAERWSEALAELQALIEDHRGEVLGAERPRPEDARLPSQMDVHAGAGVWAVRQLFELPEEGKQLYRDRFGPRAEDTLRRAIAASDRGALARVARRWPLTAAAERAWWALGDLEIELGHPADGIRAWARAAAIHIGEPMRTTIDGDGWRALRADVGERARAEEKEGALARLDMALELLESLDGEGSAAKESEASFVTGPARGVAAQSLVISAPFAGTTTAEAPTGWEAPFLLERGPFKDTNRLFPQRLGDTIFVNTSRAIHAVDAFDGEERWSKSAYDLGWGGVRSGDMQDFEQAIDKKDRIVSLAASRGVVVAPVQIPWMYQESDQYNELSIIEVIPERRLIALDADTGAELWNTLPPRGWNGDSGSFSERMTVVGPPTIVGARVLVPMAQLRGRIELHLGCFDLETGDVLWSSPLVTGQRTLNMFGRANVEFSAPPPVVVGDTAIVLTQLGIVAAVDIFTGETRWDTVYDQVPIKPPQYYSAGRLDNRWRNAPPVVTGETIVAAPFDGTSLFALDLDTGSMLWSRDQRKLSDDVHVPQKRRSGRSSRSIGGLDLLLAADESHIVLGGSRITSIEFPNGVRSGPRYFMAWTWPLEGSHSLSYGIPVLDKGRIYVPGGQRILALDRDSGLVVEEIPGRLGTGNLLVSEGMLFSTDWRQLDARFQWRAMVERARAALASAEGRAEDAATLVRLLLERAETTLGRGGAVREALVLLDEARDVIVKRAGLERPTGDDAGAGARRLPGSSSAYESLRADLFNVALLRGQGERLRGDAGAARSAVTEALTLATSEAQERTALLTLHEIERARDKTARRSILAKLRDPRHERARIRVRTSVPRGRWSGSASLGAVLEALDRGEDPEAAWSDPWGGTIYPTDALLRSQSNPVPEPGAFPKPGRGAETYESRIECRLFAHLSEIELARELGPGTLPAIEGELSSLHAILSEVPKESLFGALSGDWARARIRALRVSYPLSPALERFEAEADAMLERAVETARAPGGSAAQLDNIDRLYPGSRAAQRAADVRIEVALEMGSAADVAEIVVESLDVNWHPARTSAREAELLAQLAHTLGEEGNHGLKVGLLESMARYSPDLKINTPGAEGTSSPVTLGALA
ncbi:MAG: PQQ-binding-like beta-propeller repeat protein, partial [Planctomycetota bacterium]